MTHSNGFIVLYRSILDWEWYGDKNTTLLFIHLILTANYAPSEWRGRKIKAGQRVTSLSKLSQEISLSIKEIRTSLKHLQQTGEVACETTNQYTVITIKNYEKFQSRACATASGMASQRSNNGHVKGKRETNEGQQYNKNNKGTNKQRKENNKEKKDGGFASPPEGGELPAEGSGDDSIEIDGVLYRFPSRWRRDAETMGKDLKLFVKGMYQ